MTQTATFFQTSAAFRRWLEAHHENAEVLWVGYYKKATGKPSITWEESVEEALCFGWIDGLRKSIGPESYKIRFTPRKKRSVWSQRNIEMVERLQSQGLMRPAGIAAYAFKDAHPDSGYAVSAYEETLPGAMLEEFKSKPGAWAFYMEQPAGYRRQAARWVTSAKREATRERRLRVLIDDSSEGLRIKHLRKKK